MKIFLVAAAFAVAAFTSAANAQCPTTTVSDFNPTVMVGLTYNFGGSDAKENLGLTAKVLSTNEANHFVAGGGVSYFPGAKDKDKIGLDAGVGFNGTNVIGLAGYDLLRQSPSVSVGWAPTAEKKVIECAPSDARLKTDIHLISVQSNGTKLYSFKYLWSDETYVGVMAQDLLNDPVRHDAVLTMKNGYYAVNYQALGLRMTTLKDWQERGVDSVRL